MFSISYYYSLFSIAIIIIIIIIITVIIIFTVIIITVIIITINTGSIRRQSGLYMALVTMAATICVNLILLLSGCVLAILAKR